MSNISFSAFKQEALTTLKIGMPIVIGQLGIMAMGVADTIQVGMIPGKGAVSVAASGLSNTFYFLVSIFGLIGLGVVAPMISKAHAENQPGEISRLFRAATRVGLYIASLTFVCVAGMSFAFEHMGQDPEVSQLAKGYNLVIALSVFPLFMFVAYRQLSDGLEATGLAMKVTISAVFINVFLNWLLINGIGFFPTLGLLGAGIATLLSRIYMFIALWWLITKHRDYQTYLNAPLVPVGDLVRRIIKIGLPAGFQGFFEIGVFSAAVIVIGWYGKTQQAAHFIAINMCSVTYMMTTGIAAAGGIRVGHFWGLNDRPQMVHAGRTALLLSGGFMAIFALIFTTMPTVLVHFYTDETDVVAVARALLVIGGLFQLSDGLQATALGILRGVADVNLPTGITLFAYWVLGLPFGYVLAETYNMQALGIWLGLTVGLTASALLLCWRFFWIARRMPLESGGEKA